MNRLEKSRTDRVMSGVLGGIGEYFNIDPTILRIIFVVALVCGFGSPVILYIVMAIIMPDPSSKNKRRNFEKSDYYSNKKEYTKTSEKRKEAEKVEDDDWSDF